MKKQLLSILLLISFSKLNCMEQNNGKFHLGAIVSALVSDQINNIDEFILPHGKYEGNGIGQLHDLANHISDEGWRSYSSFPVLRRRLQAQSESLGKQFPGLKETAVSIINESKDVKLEEWFCVDNKEDKSEYKKYILSLIAFKHFGVSEKKDVFSEEYFKKVNKPEAHKPADIIVVFGEELDEETLEEILSLE